jgi:hypothetical protein
MLVQNAAAVPGRDDRGLGFACAKAVAKSTCPGARTNFTAKIPNASAKSGAGRRPSGKPSGARMKRSKPSMPRQNARAVRTPHLRHNHPVLPSLRPRVVTQQKFFAHVLCDRPGCYEPPPRTRGKPARFCCLTCRQAMRRVADRQRKWRLRGTFRGRLARMQEYAAARTRRSGQQQHTTQAPPSGPPPP